MRTEQQIKEQLKRMKELKLGSTYRGSTNYWRGVRDALKWMQDDPSCDEFLA